MDDYNRKEQTMAKAIDVYLERRKTRRRVGRLSRIGKSFVFEYDEAYRFSANPIAFGPDLPLHKNRISSSKLFPSFADRIPMRQNPAYKEYCRSAGVSPDETDLMILLSALGRKGPSSFILEPVQERPAFLREDFRKFRAKLKLSIREFADVFDISPSSVHRIESGKTGGRRILKQIKIYAENPQAALGKMQQTGSKINEAKRQFAEAVLKSEIQTPPAPGPWAVRAEDVAKCDPSQAVDLLRRLIRSECAYWGLPQSAVHVSGNIFAPDGGQDGLIKWEEGLSRTDWLPRRYNCFQMKAKSMTPSECKKELSSSKGALKPALQEVIKNKGAYILCSTYQVSGHDLEKREEKMREAVPPFLKKEECKINFYDGNRLAAWASAYPSVALWLLTEVCGKPLRSSWLSWTGWSREDEDYQFPFMLHSELEEKKNRIYEILSRPRQTARLIGSSGLGKTRLALEAFRPETSLDTTAPRASWSGTNKNRAADRARKADLSPLIIYSPAACLEESHLRDLKSARAVVIADDCPTEKAAAFHKIALQRDSRLSLLTIEHEEEALETELSQPNKIFTIKLKPDAEIVKKILSQSQDITNKHFSLGILRITEGFPLMAKFLRDAGPRALLENNIFKIRNKMLFGLQEPDKEALKALKACALFDNICMEEQKGAPLYSSPRTHKEAKYIAEKICKKTDYDEFYKHIQFFKRKQIIQQIGGFIQVRPKPLAVWLAGEFFEETPPESVIQQLSDMKISLKKPEEPPKGEKEQALARKLFEELPEEGKAFFAQYPKDSCILHGLRESFCRQMNWLQLSPKAKKLAQRLCESGGLFGTEDILNTEWGSSCFLNLSSLCPETALQTLHQIYSKKPCAAFLKKKSRDGAPPPLSMSYWSINGPKGLLPYEGAMNLIAALKNLAAEKTFYPKAARLLLKFAEGEDLKNRNCNVAAVNIFTNHFQILLSGTEAEPEEKFKIIEEIKQSSSLKQKQIALRALDKALKTGNFYRWEQEDQRTVILHRSHLNFPVQTTEGNLTAGKDWLPKTEEEALSYSRRALGLLAKFAAEDQPSEIREEAKKIIAFRLPSLFHQGLYEDWEKAVRTVASASRFPKAAESLSAFLDKNYDDKMTAEHKNRMKNLLDFLQSKDDLAERLRFYIAECPNYFDLRTLRGEKKKRYEDQFKRLLRDFQNYLKSEGFFADPLKFDAEAAAREKSPLWILFHGEQKNTARFAEEMAGSLEEPLRFALNLLEILKRWKATKNFNPSFLGGFIKGLEGWDGKKTAAAGKTPSPARYRAFVLDKIADADDLRSLLPHACFSINLQDEDIKRLMSAMDKTNFPSDELRISIGRSKCRSVSPELMSQLLGKLSEKGARAARDGLCIYESYTYSQNSETKKKEAKQKTARALFRLLTKEGLFSKQDDSSTSDWRTVLRDILDSGEILESDEYGERFSVFFCSQVLCSKDPLYNLSIGRETARKCLRHILKKRPDVVLSSTVKILSETQESSLKYSPEEKRTVRQKIDVLFKSKASIGEPEHEYHPLSAVSEEKLKFFCKKAPDHIPAFLVRNLHLLPYDKSKKRASWSRFARFLFDIYGDREEVAQAVSKNLSDFSYTGKISDYFRQIKAAAEELAGHKHKLLKNFVEKYIEQLEDRISRFSQDEKERESLGLL